MTQTARRLIGPYGATYDGAIDLGALRDAHRPVFTQRKTITVDGNTAAALPFLQWWRCPIVAGFPITPATKWLEYLAAQANGRTKRVKLLESEHAAADYIAGVGSACRSLIVGTASSSVGLDHMQESLRSLGASGLGNVIVVDVCRATANYPLCIEGDSSDAMAHRDDGFIQLMCRGKQQIYDALLQLPAVGMHPEVLIPTMPSYYGIKDSHRNGRLTVEPDDAVNAFLDSWLASVDVHGTSNDFLDGAGQGAEQPPGLLDGDTSMGNCVTSAWFQAFKVHQKKRQQRAIEVLAEVARRFERAFGRPGISPFEWHGPADAEVALVCMGPDAGTALQEREALERTLRARIAVVVARLLTPFPSRALAEALKGCSAIGVVNNAHHSGRGHMTVEVASALSEVGRAPPIEAFFCGLGGADVSVDTWQLVARTTCDAASRGRIEKPWHLVHDGVEL